MSKLIRALSISVIVMLLTASCGIGSTSEPTDTDVALALLQATPSAIQLELTVQVDTSIQYTTVNQVIKFNYTLKNTGTAGAPGVVSIPGAICPAITTIGNQNDSLDPDEVINCTADYPITQADLDKGSVTNLATATINGINSNQTSATVNVGQPKVLTITATASPTSYSQAGQQIIFTYTLRNGGSTALGPTQFTVTDNLIGSTPFTCGNANISLAPNETVSCTAPYTITQADMNAASIANLASASGGGASSSQPASTTVNKGAGSSSNSANLTAGTTITHTVINGEWLWQIARCYGADPNKMIQANPQLANPSQIKRDMVLTVPNIGSNGNIYGPPCVVTHKVAAGDTWNSIALLYNADPNILQMVKSNSLTVGGDVIVPRNSAGSTTTIPSGNKVLSITASANPVSYGQTGQQITFTYVIKNTGNTTLGPDQFKVTDNLIANQPFNCGVANTTLAPNTTTTCSAIYTITSADLNANSITSVASASGGGAGASQAVNTTVTKNAQTLTLTTSANPTGYEQAGQQITFTYVIKNSGTTNLGPAQFTVSDGLIGPTPFNCGVANTTLAPNATATCSAIYTVTASDMNAASIANNATASGGGAGPSAPAFATVNKVVKLLTLSITANPVTYNQAGQKITFTYLIKNSGTTTLGPAQFTISDMLIGPTSFNCGNADTILTPNATVSCTSTYTISQADMNVASVTNLAIASGGGAPPSQSANTTVTKQ